MKEECIRSFKRRKAFQFEGWIDAIGKISTLKLYVRLFPDVAF